MNKNKRDHFIWSYIPFGYDLRLTIILLQESWWFLRGAVASITRLVQLSKTNFFHLRIQVSNWLFVTSCLDYYSYKDCFSWPVVAAPPKSNNWGTDRPTVSHISTVKAFFRSCVLDLFLDWYLKSMGMPWLLQCIGVLGYNNSEVVVYHWLCIKQRLEYNASRTVKSCKNYEEELTKVDHDIIFF